MTMVDEILRKKSKSIVSGIISKARERQMDEKKENPGAGNEKPEAEEKKK